MKSFRHLPFVAAIVAVGLTTAAWAGGVFEGYPAVTVPLTGIEVVPADTGLANGLTPQTELITTQQLAEYSHSLGGTSGLVNGLIGGDFATNPWARGTPSGDIASTLTYGADRWWNLGGASSAINVTKITTSQTAGFGASLKFARKSGNTDVAEICMGQALISNNSFRFQGKTAVLSFWAKAGALYSDAASDINVAIASGTGVDGAATAQAAGTWTGYAETAENVVITTTWTRYTVTAAIPATAVQVGVQFCYTPVGTAGATDNFELAGVQLEASDLAVASDPQASSFAYRAAGEEQDLAQFYTYVRNEGAAGVVAEVCQVDTTTVALCTFQNPVTMRIAPTDTVTTGTYGATKADGTVQTGTLTATGTNTVEYVVNTFTAGAANLVAGNASFLIGAGGTGKIVVSSEL